MKIELIPLKEISPSPHQPRKSFDIEEIHRLAASIESVGLLQPLLVRKSQRGYELICGERRLRALNYLNKDEALCVVKEASTSEASFSSIIENVQRVDLDPIEVAQSYLQLMRTFSLTQTELAQKLGKKRSTIANTLRLLTLPPKVQQALREKKITFGHGKALLAIACKRKQLEVFKQLMQEPKSVRKVEQEAKEAQEHLFVETIVEKLQNHLGVDVKLTHKKNRGVLSLYWSDLEELNHLLNCLGMDL